MCVLHPALFETGWRLVYDENKMDENTRGWTASMVAQNMRACDHSSLLRRSAFLSLPAVCVSVLCKFLYVSPLCVCLCVCYITRRRTSCGFPGHPRSPAGLGSIKHSCSRPLLNTLLLPSIFMKPAVYLWC